MMALEGSVLQRGESPQLVQESLKSQSSKEAHAQVTTSGKKLDTTVHVMGRI